MNAAFMLELYVQHENLTVSTLNQPAEPRAKLTTWCRPDAARYGDGVARKDQ